MQCQPTPHAGIDAPERLPTLHRLTNRSTLAVIGGGPAGLRAAEVAAAAGIQVTLYDAKPSVGRKFLVAGKGGLNLTHSEPREAFISRYSSGDWADLLAGFDASALRTWADGLGVETFQASSGRVYPVALKAAPLLRRWITRLREMGVSFEMRHRWVSLEPGFQLGFADGTFARADAVVFALGGGSWPQTGSDGTWLEVFQSLGIRCQPLAPANCGWECAWPPEVIAMEGLPLKNIHVHAGDECAIGELLVTRYGLEGGAMYQLGRPLRAMTEPAVAIDFKPTFMVDQLVAKMSTVRGNFLREAAVRWKLSPAACAILGRSQWTDAVSLATEVKHCVIPLTGPRPLAEAISSAGGVRWDELDDSLMIKRLPGIFLAGEMIDWEAPTGGYLLQGCFATGTRAAEGAARWLQEIRRSQ